MLALAGLLLLGACGGNDTKQARSVTTRLGGTTTTGPGATTTTTSTSGPSSTSPAADEPAPPGPGPLPTAPLTSGDAGSEPLEPSPPDPSIPQVSLNPPRAPVGARVSVEGTGFTDEQWQASGMSLWLSGSGGEGCALYAEAEHTVRVTAGGTLEGTFVVPATGECRQSDIGSRSVQPGTYNLAFGCTACFIGRFEVT